MHDIDALRKRFADVACLWPFDPLPMIRDRGLVLGHGTLLARMTCNRRGETMLALDCDEERLLALLSAVCGRQISPRIMHYVGRASKQWRRGDKVLANIELAFARIPRLAANEDAFRLFLAENLLTQGFTPRRLARELGFDPRLLKYDEHYDEHEPRDWHGRWVRVGDGGQSDADQSDHWVRIDAENHEESGTSTRTARQFAEAVPRASFLARASPALIEALGSGYGPTTKRLPYLSRVSAFRPSSLARFSFRHRILAAFTKGRCQALAASIIAMTGRWVRSS